MTLNDFPLLTAKLDEVLNEVAVTSVQCRTYMADVSNEQEVKAMNLVIARCDTFHRLLEWQKYSAER